MAMSACRRRRVPVASTRLCGARLTLSMSMPSTRLAVLGRTRCVVGRPSRPVLGQLADVADREAGELRDALDADAGGAQSGDVFADRIGVDVGVPAAVDPFPGRGAAGRGVGGGAVACSGSGP